MSKPLVTYPDPERVHVDLLTALLTDEDCTVGVPLPDGWKATDSPLHVQPVLDGTPIDEHPIALRCTMRIVVWGKNTSDVKALALLAHGHLLAHVGPTVSTISPLTGLLPAHDPDRDAELASFTVRTRIRSTPIT